MSFRFSVTKQTHTEYKTINYTMTSTRRHQLDEVNSQNAERNGMSDFGAQQMPCYTVFVGENGFSDVS